METLVLKNLTDFGRQRWQVVLDHFPSQLKINPKVLVDHDVTSPCNISPWDVWILGPKIFGEPFHGLTYDFEAPNDRVLLFDILGEGVVTQPIGIALKKLDRFQDFAEKYVDAPTHRSGTSSPRI